jgi:hypothetical protein
VKRAGGAQKAATASSKGLKGTLSSIRAEAISSADALYRKYSPAVDKGLQKVVASAKKDLPGALDKARDAVQELLPTLQSLLELAVDLGGDIKDLATGPIGKNLVGALKILVGLTKSAADLLSSVPSPIRQIGVEAGAASLLLPRFTGAVTSATTSVRTNVAALQQWRAEMTYGVTRAQNLESAIGKVGAAAKTAAGIGGMLALVDGAKRSESALGRLESAAGGAALGFAVGGPWGAIIGGAAGTIIPALRDLAGRSDDVAGSMEAAKPKIRDFASTLDQVTAASTAATRQLALQSLQERGSLEQGLTLGLNQRTLIDATLGHKDALAQVKAAIDQYSNAAILAAQRANVVSGAMGGVRLTTSAAGQATIDQARAAEGLAGSLGVLTPQLRAQQRETRSAAIATADLSALFPDLRKGAIGKIRLLGTEASINDVLKLNAKLKLTPRDLRTALRVTGAVDSERAANRVVRALQAAGKTKVNPDIASGVKRAADKAKGAADKGSRDLVDAFEQRLNKTKASMPQLAPSVRQAAAGAEGSARAGGSGIGSAVKTGFDAGFAGAILAWSASVRAAVRAAINAGRAEAKAHSPSRETERLGKDLADGLGVGLRKQEGAAREHGKSLVQQVLAGVQDGSDGVDKAIDKLEKLIRRRVTGKGDEKRENAILKSLRDEEKALKAQGRAIDRVNQKLEAARDRLAELQQQAADYAASIQQSFVDTANIANLGQDENGKFSLQNLLTQLRQKAQQAQQFAQVIRSLQAEGLNSTSVQQLLTAGPESLAAAQAILQGGASAIGQINDLTSQIAAAGASLGQDMSVQFYGAGVAAAEGLVKGLKDEKKGLQRVAKQLADALVEEIKKALKMKSPSRVFMDIGHQSVRGLAIGMDDIYVRRQGRSLATALTDGFGQPALAAFLGTGGGGTLPPQTIHLTADVIDEMQRGKKIVTSVDTYLTGGGTRRRNRVP